MLDEKKKKTKNLTSKLKRSKKVLIKNFQNMILCYVKMLKTKTFSPHYFNDFCNIHPVDEN